jgi:hypothetical protein
MVTETKLLAVNKQNKVAPNEIKTGANCYKASFLLGDLLPSAFDQKINLLGGIATTQGFANGQRIGNYIYLKKTHMTFNLDMLPDNAIAPGPFASPTRFRVIVYKLRRLSSVPGQILAPQNHLFLDEQGNSYGTASAGKGYMDYWSDPLNRRSFTIACDKKFTLTCPHEESGTTGFSAYKSAKTMILNLPHYVKAFIPSTATEPDNYNYMWFVDFLSMPQNGLLAADRWTVEARGSTSFTE